jgi:hypothetical protein
MSKGGSRSSGSSTQKVKQVVDPFVREQQTKAIEEAERVASNLQQRQFAPFTPLYEQGEQMALAAAGGPGSQALDEAMGVTQGLTGFTPAQIAFDQDLVNQYFNPFQQQVVDQTLADIERQRQMASQGLGERATAARAFGGSRQGVAEGVMAGEFGRTAAQTAANLRSQGFQSALDRAMQQQLVNQQAGLAGAQFRLGAGQQLAGMGQLRTAADLLAAQTAMGLGGARQEFAQQELDAARNIDLERLGIRQSTMPFTTAAMGGTTTTTGTQPAMRSNPVAGALGGALTGASLFGTGGALAGMGGISAAGGAGIGALLGLI